MTLHIRPPEPRGINVPLALLGGAVGGPAAILLLVLLMEALS